MPAWKRWLSFAALGTLFVFTAVYADLLLRARTAYLEGEKYLSWNVDPSRKKAHFQKIFERSVAELDAEKAAGRMDETEYRQRVALEEFRRDESVAESSLKYAYHWYKTAVDLFSPPESKWVRLSREKMKTTKALWKAELDAAKIPYEEYMLE
ncbi:MAG: hypothetical protein AUJ52_13425 [Elusimicrobia bacterium CG1_02_63_36]|nr:MAG: hypothetical protein AUJ52_13425 [Elusimicrobia bacterium CG1_02_63_36]PIP83556.1 MAG: hypothetical protein COR54_08870 [Elusimicrobia bacterium CG22_combo_CG10-13_8_21_14_all_63_91]PJA13136.1 MAG: hypothetical protein COX66_15720 [Elusimicrobia bacterium CG_4_10_14_0_2_um_filter_63_34]PJB26061.1 MAG: hypothetical protein CO113_05475 [Elusimicrobia bacterium CG_4_9_14_3_um_filter_62_55]